MRRYGLSLVGALTLVLTVVPAHAGPVPATECAPLTFGIYPGGYAGGGSPNPAPDNEAKDIAALDTLQGNQNRFLVREYVGYDGSSTAGTDAAQFLPYLGHGRRLDLVLNYPGKSTPLAGWLEYVRDEVRFAGPFTADLSLGVDVNLDADQDPSYLPAVVQGVIAAKQQARQLGYRWLRVGFDTVQFNTADTTFWPSLAAAGGQRLREALDYVGVELYPDVFRPSPGDHGAQAIAMLNVLRSQEMPLVGLGSNVPIRVSENGWDTIGARTPAQQADVVKSEITAIEQNQAKLTIASYEFFDLRDALSGSTNMFDHFGLMLDDYTPKPAFWTYQALIRTADPDLCPARAQSG